MERFKRTVGIFNSGRIIMAELGDKRLREIAERIVTTYSEVEPIPSVLAVLRSELEPLLSVAEAMLNRYPSLKIVDALSADSGYGHRIYTSEIDDTTLVKWIEELSKWQK